MQHETRRLGPPESGTNVSKTWNAWDIGFLPVIVLLGVTLPLTFLTWIDRYLYYLHPVELIPTYGTAWLLMAAPATAAALLCVLVLKKLEPLQSLRWAHCALSFVLLSVATASMGCGAGYAALLWLNEFGLLTNLPVLPALVACAAIAIALVVCRREGRKSLSNAYGFAKVFTALGALAVVSLPFSGGHPRARPTLPDGASTNLHSRPNILLVTIDTLSASHMSLYGAARQTTPRLQAFASTATTFDRAYANSNFTTAGISSILTATRPWSNRALQLLAWPTAKSRDNSIPAVLARGGYLTAYFGTNPYASPAKNRMGSYFDIRHGEQEPYFSICSDLLSTFLPYDCSAAELPQFLFVRKILNKIIEGLAAQPNWQFDPRACIRPALDWLATTDRHQPVFLWLHFYPPHTPYAAPAPWLGEFDPSPRARDWAHSQPRLAFQFSSTTPEEAHTLEARYDESIKYVDHFVGDFLDQATRLLGDDTVVIVTADHGENFGHGYGQHAGPALYESVIHIPLIIKLPHQTRGQRTSVLAQQIDIGPTLAELVGLGVPSSWEGRSLLNFATAGQPDTPDSPPPIFSMNFEENHRDAALTTGSVAVIDGDWKLVHYAGKLHYPNMPELHDGLFDLASDPGELTNHIDSQPETAQRLRRLIDSNLTRYGAADP